VPKECLPLVDWGEKQLVQAIPSKLRPGRMPHRDRRKIHREEVTANS
jgi:hypothetical protein